MKLAPSIVGLTLVFLVPGCDSGPEPGSDCKSDDECGSLSCYCYQDPVPGTCSEECTDNADCAHFGEGYTCEDFGTDGVCGPYKICLRTQ